MCGLLLHFAKEERARLPEHTFAGMLSQLARRGPDDQCIFTRGAVMLGHRRLSIIDLAGGQQPLFNEDRSIALVANGEIYNHLELRAQLEAAGHRFRTHSDSEVIVHLYEDHGVAALDRLSGMFGFALVDFARERIVIARDRLGEKPLYYVDRPDLFACASEIKALLHLPGLRAHVDQSALRDYLQFGWVAGSQSFVAGIHKLPPAHYLVLERSRATQRRYWSPDLTPMPDVSRDQVVEQLRSKLDAAISTKLGADVPVGVLLSGGLDSSTVVACASRYTNRPLRTFSVGFGSALNELPYAREVAEMFETDHTEVMLETDLERAVLDVARYFDEPFGDSSAVPTFLICREARRHVTVMLTGDGGDELLGGYAAYLPLRAYSDVRLLRGVARRLDRISERWFGRGLLDSCYPLPLAGGAAREWQKLRSRFTPQEISSLVGAAAADGADCEASAESGADPLSCAFAFDLARYLPDDLLKKVDMASMANGLECRAPFLDHHFVEFCMRIPPHYKVWGNQTKSLLREAMAPILPQRILHRPKHGFGAPIEKWVRGELREMIHDMLAPGALIDDLLDPAVTRSWLDRSMADIHDDWRAPPRIWTFFMLEMWLREHSKNVILYNESNAASRLRSQSDPETGRAAAHF